MNLPSAYGFGNIGYLLQDVPNDILSVFDKEIEHATVPYNHNLAGNIEKEFSLEHIIPNVENYFCWLGMQFKDAFQFNPRGVTANSKIVLKDLWVNIQEKYEFNPVHNHSGLFSFVIWYDIPYTIEDELELSPGKKSNNNLAGHFEFQYINSIGEITTLPIPADKSFNKKICFFPAQMMHCVYPFYSEGKRITISGNVSVA